QIAVNECFGPDALIVDYIRPGFELSRRVAAVCRTRPDCRVLILRHHGLVTWGDTPRQAYDAHIDAVTTAEEFLASRRNDRTIFKSATAELPSSKRHEVAAAVTQAIRKAIANALSEARCPHRMLLRYDDSPRVLSFVNSNDLDRVVG